MVRIRSDIGSCSTLCWDMIREAGLNPNDNRLLATALYYGLYTDTNRLSEVSHPLDRDMMDTLVINKGPSPRWSIQISPLMSFRSPARRY